VHDNFLYFLTGSPAVEGLIGRVNLKDNLESLAIPAQFSAECPLNSSTSISTSTSTTSSTTSGTSSGTTSSYACQIISTITPRAGAGASWISDAGAYQIYDIDVTNVGSCVVSWVVLSINLPAGASISSTWNLQVYSGSSYTVNLFGNSIVPGGSLTSSGFVVFSPNTRIIPSFGVSVVVYTVTCNNCAFSSTSGSAVSTTSGTTSNSACQVSPTLTPRSSAGGSWISDAGAYQIYDIDVLNVGSCLVYNVVLSFDLPAGSSISSTWNLQVYSGSSYTVNLFGNSISPGGSLTSSGFVVFSPNTRIIPSFGVSVIVNTATCSTCS